MGPRILLINDVRKFGNWGSEALTDAIIDIFHQEMPGSEVSTIPCEYLARKYLRTPRWLGGRIYKQFRPRYFQDLLFEKVDWVPRVADEYDFFADAWLERRVGRPADEYLEALEGVDAVVYNGEGSMYRVNDWAVRGLFMLWLAKTRLGIPAFFMNGTVAMTQIDPVLPAMARKSFCAIDGVAVREPWSQRNVREHVPGLDVRLIPDSVFHLRREQAPPPSDRLEQTLAALGDTPYFCFSHTNLAMDYKVTRGRSSLSDLIRRLQEVVPQCVIMARDSKDLFVRGLAEEVGAIFVGAEHSYWDVHDVLAGAQFLLTGRYHHTILATMAGCPTVPLTTSSPKMDGLCELLDGLIGDPFDATDLWTVGPQIVAAAERATADRAVLSARLLEVADRHRGATNALGAMVREVVT